MSPPFLWKPLVALAIYGIVSILLIVGGIVIYKYTDDDAVSPVLVCVGIALAFITFIASIVFGSSLVKGRFIDDKIEFYENDNEAVYNEISNIAKAYCDYEKETVDKVTELIERKADPATILTVLPSLRSSELYAKQMDIYNANRTRIRELQEDKIDLKEDRWWLYFGE